MVVSDRADGERCRRGDLGGKGDGTATELLARDEVVAQPDLVRRGTVDAAPGVEEVEGGLLPDHAREGDGEAEAGVEAELREVRREPRLGGGDPEVGGEGEAETAADRRALDRGDDRQRLLEQPDGDVVQVRSTVAADAPGRAAEVRTRTEVLALAAQHDGTRVAACNLGHLVGEMGEDVDVEVVVRAPADLDGGDVGRGVELRSHIRHGPVVPRHPDVVRSGSVRIPR